MQTDEQIVFLKGLSREKPLDRRDFVRALTLATAAGPGLVGAALSGFMMTRSQRAEAAEAVVAGLGGRLPRVKYGDRTNMRVTRVCISQDWHPDLIEPALAMGINFIHKAGYWRSAEAVPEAVRALPRESYYTDITVDTTSPGHDPDNLNEAYEQVTNSLRANGLKYYDVYRAHYGWHTVDKFKNNNISFKAFERLKKEGLVRHFAVSQHPYPSERIPDYPAMIEAQIESGIIDSMQVWYTYNYPKEVQECFAKASKAGIAMTAMKMNAHGRGPMSGDPALMASLKAEGMPSRAVIRKVMTTRRSDGKSIFHTCVTAPGNLQAFEENVGALSATVALNDGFEEAVA